MSLFKFTPQAAADLFDIWTYIAADNPEAADRVEKAIYDACQLISAEPLIGHVRMELIPLPCAFGPYSAIPTISSSTTQRPTLFKSFVFSTPSAT